MSSDAAFRQPPDRREFLKTTGAVTAGAVMAQSLDGVARTLLESADGAAAQAAWRVRPFALTMRLAANMTAGHIAILSILSFVFLFTEMFSRAIGMGVGVLVSIPLAVGISMLEMVVVLVQAYVFTLLSAVFIGMAIHAHH